MFAGSSPALGTEQHKWLGRQLADHFGSGTDRRLVAEMLRVRIPPELLTYVLVEQRSARLPVTQEIVGSNPIEDAYLARYANR